MDESTIRSFYPPSLFQQDKALLFWTEHHLPNPAADRDYPLHEGVATAYNRRAFLRPFDFFKRPLNNPVSFIYSNLNHISSYIQNLLDLIDLYAQTEAQTDASIVENTENIDLAFIRQDCPNLLASMKTGSDRIQDNVASLRNFSRLDESGVKAVNIHYGIDSTLMIVQHRLKANQARPEI
jgi:signal transduction histidine kinase